MTEQEKAIYEACIRLTVKLPDGSFMPQLGQGTWKLGEHPAKYNTEKKALQRGLELGMKLLDTAEMYGEGLSESLIGDTIRDIPREELFIVSKVYPHNAGKKHIFQSCENSLKRLGTDVLDLYLLHWRGSVPLAETVECMEQLVAQGKIRRWGVSNFDTDDMEELWQVPNGKNCTVNQVLYHLGSRGIEYDLLPWQRAHGVPVMAYCPLAQGGGPRAALLRNQTVIQIANQYHVTPAQVLLSFILHDPMLIAIPKAGSPAHTEENASAALVHLSEQDYKTLSAAFPAPRYKTPLDMR